MLGLGNMDLTGKTKGYGRKKGGRKMLPLGRPIPRYEEGMATIQPYGGAYGLTDIILNSTGDLIKAGVKGLANTGLSVAKDLAKTGIQQLADKGVKALGKGKKKRKMKGCGKINGKYVSSEYEANYEDALSKNRLLNEMARMNAEQQMEQAILNQQNMEQQSALSQLEYHNLLRTIQRENQ